MGKIGGKIPPIYLYKEIQMDLKEKYARIYSRPRINFDGKIKRSKGSNENNFVKKLICIFAIATVTATIIIKSINPIVDTLCIDEAKNIATRISNEEATEIMEKYKYEDFVNITKDSDNNVVMIQANVNAINGIISDIPVHILDKLKENENSNIRISMGSMLGIKLLSGYGPKINAKIASTGNVETNLKSDFISQGINQTLHKIYLELNMDVNILTPYNVTNSRITNQVLIAESIIVGNVPNSYYNLNSSSPSESIRLIE